MATEYNSWIKKQDKEFVQELHNGAYPEQFEDANFTGINLTKLRELDDKYINIEDIND